MPTKSRIAATRSAASIPAVLTSIIAATALLLVPGLAAARQADAHRAGPGAGARIPVPATGPDLAPVLEQHSRGGGSSGGGGQAVPRGGAGSGSGGGAGSGSGGGSGGSGDGARTRSGSGGGSDPGVGPSGTSSSRPRDGRPATGTAVERRGDTGGGSRGSGGGTVGVGGGYYGGFYPWGWGGLGLGGYYGYYDPYGWGWDEPYQPPMSYGYGYDGALKLKVTPRQAEVLVDGYFAGAVDDYDGLFQRLRLDAGPHRIEIRLDGYEPLSFEVRIQPDRTVTYKGEMRREEP